MLLTIGAFDGFHRGHAELFRICRELSSGNEWGILTFEPHPSEYLTHTAHSLFTLREKELIRRILDIPNMYALKFDASLMELSPYEFWRMIRARFNVTGLVVGSDFRFGRKRSGNAESLKRLAINDGITNVYISPLLDKPEYSSSKVRECITAGNVDMAGSILGYPYFVMGSVIHGSERGRTISYPTANIALDASRVIPAYGVYSCAVLVDGECYCGALSIGNNPTFGDINGVRIEVHILDFSGDIYGKELAVFLLERVRGIETFANEGALKAQIGQDTQQCLEIYTQAMKGTDAGKFIIRAGEIYPTITAPETINLTQRL